MREAVPILTVAQLIGNGSRVWFNRRKLDWGVVAWFASGVVPLALIGGCVMCIWHWDHRNHRSPRDRLSHCNPP